ncbi:23S rRNA (uracil(1939)-C(5))-methyltransferase RlmD [Halarsenatibacter silvermanii]|uniref:23S rRNA m(5)U-1939 methyltransferase n=1 Tax=Halarsenatibacter silvermanii TaxID=321763 RepID=A0A1G9NHL7_9FIRM|nr:23S rRNA (uracil(1939)-C(5))-methyltransferase RlmD [Halarsenatibacter silvermanii]SDL85840.1 23S rRNA m(5)U-1939 methyltransferase [Halarsenatibacter silvermanii]
MKNFRKYIVKILDLSSQGEGVARPEDLPVFFVPGALPGEKVEVRPTKKKKNYWRTELLSVREASGHRVNPRCDVYESCGGCNLQHLGYRVQLKEKEKIIKNSLSRIGGVEELPEFSVTGMDFPWYYRNKGQFPVGREDAKKGEEGGRVRAGLYKKGSHELVFFDECPIQHQPINRLIKETEKRLNRYEITPYNEGKHSGNLRHLVIRGAVCSSQLQLTFVTRRGKLPSRKEITAELIEEIRSLWSIYHSVNAEDTNVILGDEIELVTGERFITEYIRDKKFYIHPSSFFQVNTQQTEKLYERVLSLARDVSPRRIIDAYCGAGTIGIYLADGMKGDIEKTLGIEEVPQAVQAAAVNSSLNECRNVDFIQGKVEKVLPRLDLKEELVIVDPPRKGLSENSCQTILDSSPSAVVYVSCNPGTLARDISRLSTSFRLEKIEAVDMFPHTHHVETAVLLVRD